MEQWDVSSRAHTGKIPTRFGDVLILTTERAGTSHIVCPVPTDGQQTCSADHHLVSGRAAAVTKARSLVVPEGRIFLRDLDTGEWGEISN